MCDLFRASRKSWHQPDASERLATTELATYGMTATYGVTSGPP